MRKEVILVKKRAIWVVVVTTSLMLATLLPACAAEAPPEGPTEEEVYEFTLAVSPSLEATNFGWFSDVIDELEEETNGRIKIVVYGEGEHPYKYSDLYIVTRDGIYDMAVFMTSYMAGVEPIISLFDLPLLFSCVDEIFDLYTDPDYAYLFDEVIHQTMAKYNAKLIVNSPHIGYGIGLDRFVENWDSLKGRKIRTYSPEMEEMILVLNGTPVAIPWAEVYPALQSGIVDGWCTNLRSAYRVKFFEITKYYTYMDFQTGITWIMMNTDAYKELPPDLREIFDAKMAKRQPWFQQWMVEIDEEAAALVKRDYGGECIYMPKDFRAEAREQMKPVWQDWAERTGGNAAHLLEVLEEYHTKWVAAHEVRA